MKFFRQHLCLFLALTTLTVGHQACAGTDAAPGSTANPPPKVAIALSGKVMETMDGGGYTYVLLKNGNDKVWVAIPLMKVSVGQDLTLVPGYELKNFTSKGLNRKFDRLIFSAGLDSKSIKLSPSAIKMAHEGVPLAPQTAPAPAPAPKAAAPAAPAATKSNAGKAAAPISIEQIAKAKGPNAYTIAQLYAKKTKLEKKPVVVRGRVVKVTTRIMKRNWIHIQDGSGTGSKKNNELVVTTLDLPKEGDLVTARGTLYNNIDFGSGYRYSLLMQGARLK
jgi:hypothetical protein